MNKEVIKFAKEIAEKLLPTIIDWAKEFLNDVLREGLPKHPSRSNATFKGEIVDIPFLNQTSLVEQTRNNAPKNANGAVAYRKATEKDYYIYITYMQDDELLPKENNYQFVIKSERQARDIENLFEGRELIILK